MGLTIEDLKPKKFKINIKGVEVECSPVRLSHALILTQVGETFKNVKDSTVEEIKTAETNMDSLVSELMPELSGVKLDIASIIEIITQMMETIQPSDNKELNDKGVKFNADLKAETTGS